MPQPPPTDGLPVWAQVVISIMFGIGTLYTAFKGYFGKAKESVGGVPASPLAEQASARVLSATIMDAGAFRHLADTVVQLSANVIALTEAINETTHYNRNEVDLLRDMCRELQRLTEEMQRQGRDIRGWDRRNEDRRDEGRAID